MGSPKDRRKAQPQRPTELGSSQLLQLTSLAKEGLCTCLILRERLRVMAVLLQHAPLNIPGIQMQKEKINHFEVSGKGRSGRARSRYSWAVRAGRLPALAVLGSGQVGEPHRPSPALSLGVSGHQLVLGSAGSGEERRVGSRGAAAASNPAGKEESSARESLHCFTCWELRPP